VSTGGGRDLQKIGAHDDVTFVDQAAQAAAQQSADARAAARAAGAEPDAGRVRPGRR